MAGRPHTHEKPYSKNSKAAQTGLDGEPGKDTKWGEKGKQCGSRESWGRCDENTENSQLIKHTEKFTIYEMVSQ